MNTFTFALGFALIAVTAAHSGSSYVTRHDLSHEVQHGHGGGDDGSYHGGYEEQHGHGHSGGDDGSYHGGYEEQHGHGHSGGDDGSYHGGDEGLYHGGDEGSYHGGDAGSYIHDAGSSHGHDDHKDYYAHPQYKFEYGVKDGHTGDHKSQWEHRDGDVVKGGYTVDEADGTKRVVEYTSNKKNGFNAIVKKIGHAHHPAVYGHHESHGHY